MEKIVPTRLEIFGRVVLSERWFGASRRAAYRSFSAFTPLGP